MGVLLWAAMWLLLSCSEPTFPFILGSPQPQPRAGTLPHSNGVEPASKDAPSLPQAMFHIVHVLGGPLLNPAGLYLMPGQWKVAEVRLRDF